MNENAKLSEEKLLECFKSLNFPIRMNDLKTPTKEFIFQVFDVFLKDLQINITNPLLRSFESIGHLENPEMYEESRLIIILASVMTELLSNVTPIIISINDIISPKPKRTKKILNILVIVWKNYLKNFYLFREIEQNLQEEIQKYEDVKIEKNALEDKYQEYMIAYQNQQYSSDELNKLLDTKGEKMKQFEKCREEFIEQYSQLKEKETNTMTEIANADVLIVTVKEKLNELDQLIISSPEKMNTDILKLKDKVKELEDKIQEKELEKKEKKKKSQYLEKAHELLSKNCTKQHKILDEVQMLMEDAHNFCSLKNKYREENAILQELSSSQERKEAMASIYDQNASKIQLSKKMQIEEITKTHKILQKQLAEENNQKEKLISLISPLNKKIDNEVQELKEVVEKMKKAKTHTDEFKNVYKAELLRIEENFKSDCKTVREKAQQIFGQK